jgi:hypothetical protein
MSAGKTYEPLSSARLDRWHAEKQYRANANECFELAARAYTPLEKQAWEELGQDWLSLAAEVRDVALESQQTSSPQT